jgi:hypothetical protein
MKIVPLNPIGNGYACSSNRPLYPAPSATEMKTVTG